MRVLLLHNRYRSLGGEERAVGEIARLLASRGHEVEVLERSSLEAGSARAAAGLLRGGLSPVDVVTAVRRLGADVVHAHNVHPLFGWRALEAARSAGARTVLHVHNFRLFCAVAVAYRDGAPCFRCRGANTLPGLVLRCRGSVPEAAVYAAALHRQQPRLFAFSDRFISVAEAHARRLVELGLPSARTAVLPNFIAERRFAERSGAGDGRYALISGRLVEEKGFDTAVLACRAADVPLVVAGEGPDEPRLRELAAGGEVTFKGRVPEEALDELRAYGCVRAGPLAVRGGVPVLGPRRARRRVSRHWSRRVAASRSWSNLTPRSTPKMPGHGRTQSASCGASRAGARQWATERSSGRARSWARMPTTSGCSRSMARRVSA